MQISELAQRTGFSIDTIRFYEKKGLIDKAFIHRKSNSYREYTDHAVERLVFIQRAKRLGFTLAEIQKFIHDWENNVLTDDQKEALLRQKIALIDGQIHELEQMKGYLLYKIDFIRHTPNLQYKTDIAVSTNWPLLDSNR
jgi:MerR family Zn(II)-responsive transcriptional regulator of zntA